MNSLPTTPDEDHLIDFKEVSRLLGGISERTIRRLIASGELPAAVKVRNTPRLYHSDVVAYITKLKQLRDAKARKQSAREKNA